MLALLWLLISPADSAPRQYASCYPSGLKLVIESRPGDPVTSVTAVIGGGSRAESDEQAGAAHMAEHLWFRSHADDAVPVDEQLHALGAEVNGFTSWDHTIFVSVAPADSLETLLDLEQRRLSDPLQNSQAVFEPERDVVRAEIFERYDGLPLGLPQLLEAQVGSNHGYGRSVSATPDAVASLELDAVQAYVDEVYRPDNATLLVTAPLRSDALVEAIEDRLGALLDPERPTVPRRRACKVDRSYIAKRIPDLVGTSAAIVLRGAVDDPTLYFGWSLPPEPEVVEVADVLARLLRQRISRATALDPWCRVVELDELTELYCGASLDAGWGDVDFWRKRIGAATEGLWVRALDDDGSRWISRATFWSTRQSRYAELAKQRISTSPSGHVVESAIWTHRTGTVERPELDFDPYAAMHVGKRWLTSARMRTVLLEPSDDVKHAGARYHAERAWDAEPAPVDASRGRLEELLSLPDLSGATHATLANGMQVHVLRDERADWPLVQVWFERDARFWHESNRMDAAFSWLADPWSQAVYVTGSSAYSGGQALWVSDGEGPWTWGVDSDDPSWSIGALAVLFEHLDPLDRASDRRSHARRVLDRWSESQEQAGFHAALLRLEWVTEQPVPHWSEEAVQEWAGLSRGRARRIVQSIRTPQRAHLIVIGDVDPNDVLGHARVFERWQPRSKPFEVAAASERGPAPDPEVWLLDDPDAGSQVELGLACRLADSTSATIGVLGTLLQDRLNRDLRATRGLTYGVHTRTWRSPTGPALDLTLRLPPDRSAEAIEALREALGSLAAGEADPNRVDALKVRQARRSALDFRSVDSLPWLVYVDAVVGDQAEQDPLTELADVDPQALADVLSECVGHEAITLVGDGATLRQTLDDAGIEHLGFGW